MNWTAIIQRKCRSAAACLATLAIAMLAGCGTLPRIVPDMEWFDPDAVRIVGAHGPLSIQQSKAILDRLKDKTANASVLDRHLALEEAISGSPLVVGNHVTLLKDGPATFAAMFEAIRGAEDHINMETFTIDDDEIGRRFADALIEKRSQGVQVNLIYDSFGSLATPPAFFKRLTDAGVKVVEFNPLNPLQAKAGWNVNQRDHRKLLIVDGRTAFLGGVNISSVYSGGSFDARRTAPPEAQAPWRDTHLRVEGPVVAEFQRLFVTSWEKQHGAPLANGNYFPRLSPQGKEVVRAIGSSPDDHYTLMYATLISAIRCAETEVYLTNAYFVPDPQLLEALTQAARRGVDVRLILPSYTDSWLTLNAGRSYYTDLLEAGVKIYERRNRLLHAKTALIDGVWSTIGSTNLDWRSFLHNDEVNAVILGQEFGTQMRVMFEQDLAASNEITLENWNERSLPMRIREAIARLWQRGL